ncbi:MAG: aldehyde ferredoxin oxidoreductase family protein [Methanomicrobiaceae archaeon]|nr:aldehyde ferredoxin oxidoreductase family protein [Methanomicrobiaceae archaeon]
MPPDGYAGRILAVDLSRKTLSNEPLPPEWKDRYLGGRGFGVAAVRERVRPGTDPFAPENVLVFAAGPLTGSGMPLGARYDVVTASPLTGTLTSANSGGFFGTALKRAGFDAVIISGASATPLYLYIDGQAELRDASAYHGMGTGETARAIAADTGEAGIRVAAIGPAGERRCRMAAVMNDGGRAAGRGGVGAVMGAKNVKAVAVLGTGTVGVADPERARDVGRQILRTLKETGLTTGSLRTHGTAGVLPRINGLGILPTRNFREGMFEGAENVSGERMTETLLKGRKPCYACSVGCGRITESGGVSGEGPEYETIWALGPACGIDDLPKIAEANYLCNELGLDTISTGSTIACAMEIAEDGHIDTGFRFGDAGALGRIVRMIGYREGIGDLLAEGSYRTAAFVGHPDYSMSVKGQELPAYDPRGLQGLGLNYATSVRGGCHVYGNMLYAEVIGSPVRLDPYTTEGKAEWTKEFQDLGAAIDAAGICIFTERVLWAPEYALMVAAVTGREIDAKGLLRTGERIWNLQKLWNIGAGLTRDDDTLPARFLTVPLREGPPAGEVWRRDELLPAYYAARGWDEQGVPKPETLRALDIA